MSGGDRPAASPPTIATAGRNASPDFFGRKGTAPGFFDGPVALSVRPGGTILIVDAGNGRVQHVAPDGDSIGVIASPGSASGQVRFPEGMANAPDGSVIVSDGGNNRIQMFTADGHVRGIWGQSGAGPKAFAVPRGVVISRTGVVHVADSRNHRIQRLTTDGRFLGAWGGSGMGLAWAPSNSMHRSVSHWTKAETWRLPIPGTAGSDCLMWMAGISGPWAGSEINLANSAVLKAYFLILKAALLLPTQATIASRYSVVRTASIPLLNS